MTQFPPSESDLNPPEPLEEFDSELHQPLSDLDTESDAGFRWKLRIDELVAGISDITEVQGVEIVELLWEFCYRRARRWQWLKNKKWTGQSLLLFLSFQDFWEENKEWWESVFHTRRTDVWYSWNSSNLSWENTYLLIQNRLHCLPDEVIDSEWFEDWQQYGLWQRGFPSFASYALFRSKFRDGESWQQDIDWDKYTDLAQEDSIDSTIEGNILNDYELEHIVYRCMLPQWFVHQNWYDPGEWHDNLGWDI